MPNRIYTSTGIFRAYRRRVLDSLELESDGKEIHLEILSKVIALGYRVKEIPAILTESEEREIEVQVPEDSPFPSGLFLL